MNADASLRAARADDAGAIERLLIASSLPTAGVAEALDGFIVPTTREAVPAPVRDSREFQDLCPASAVVMVRPCAGAC